MLNQISEKIYQKLENKKVEYRSFFDNSNNDFGAKYCVIDNLLPEDLALEINDNFPNYKDMRFLNSMREKKYTSKNFSSFNKIINDISLSFHDKKVINKISEITSIDNPESDDSFYAGGLSSMVYGNFLNPHLDNSHNYNLTHYRVLNLLYYITPEWKKEDGAHLELWDEKVKKNKIIESKFNRLVLMETNDISWHSVSKCENKSISRNCISNYYFSVNSINGKKYNNITKFNGRPNQKIKRLICSLDNFVRQSLRLIKKKGFSKKDLNLK